MIPTGTTVVIGLVVAGLLGLLAHVRSWQARVFTGLATVAALVALRVVPSPAITDLFAVRGGLALIGIALVHRLIAPRFELEHDNRHALIGGMVFGGFSTASALVKTGQDRRHTARLAALAWVAGVCSPLGGLGTVAWLTTPQWAFVAIPLLAVCAGLLRGQSRTPACPPDHQSMERVSPALVALGIAALVHGVGGAWHLAQWTNAQTPLMLFGLTAGAPLLVDPAVIALSHERVALLGAGGPPLVPLAIWLGLACTPVPVVTLLFARFGGDAVRDLRYALIPFGIGLLVAIGMTTTY